MFMAGWIIEMHTRYRVNIKPECIIKTRPFHYYVIYTYSLRPLTPGYGLQSLNIYHRQWGVSVQLRFKPLMLGRP
jgi:hypothetical protein